MSAGGPSQRADEPRRDPGGGLLVGRPFGVPIYVSPTWLIIAVLITVSFGPFVQSRIPSLGSLAYVVSFAFAVLLYVSVLVHELAHSVVALRFGLPVRRISLYLLGGVSEIEKEAPSPGREFLIAVAGPVLSLVLGGIGFAAAQALEPGTVVHLLVLEVAFANLLVGVFNLLPGLPLDGGRLVQAGCGSHGVGWRGSRLRREGQPSPPSSFSCRSFRSAAVATRPAAGAWAASLAFWVGRRRGPAVGAGRELCGAAVRSPHPVRHSGAGTLPSGRRCGD